LKRGFGGLFARGELAAELVDYFRFDIVISYLYDRMKFSNEAGRCLPGQFIAAPHARMNLKAPRGESLS
jgi:hypothetical protein